VTVVRAANPVAGRDRRRTDQGRCVGLALVERGTRLGPITDQEGGPHG
jgi:hypothetical protein